MSDGGGGGGSRGRDHQTVEPQITQILTKIYQILIKMLKITKIHVQNFQECHFSRIKKSNVKIISRNAIFSELKNPMPYKSTV